MEYHELCLMFPRDQEAIDAVKADMQKNGFVDGHSIVTLDDKILDGRHRYEAAMELGIKPKFTKFKGDDPMRFVIRENFNRRHLSTGQKAMLATKLATLKHGGDRKSNKIKGLIKPLISSQITIEEAATITGASKDSIKRAKAIVAADPELAAKIEANTMSLNAASVELEEKKSTITSVDPKLWNDVVESKTPIQEALDVANKIAAAKKKEQEAERKKRAEEAKKIAEEEKRKKLLEKQRAERERLEKLAKANMTREEALRVFGIYVDDPGARITKEALTILYRGFAKLHHPDSNGGTQSDAFIEVKAAYESLLNNERAIK